MAPFASAAAVAAMVPGSVHADTLVLEPVADTAILEEGFPVDDDYNLGSENRIPSGARGSMDGIDGAVGRILIAFPIADHLPRGAVITGARLRMTVVREPIGRRDGAFTLRRMLTPWTEGDGRGSDPGGRQALPGEVTWNAARHQLLSWAQPGGLEGVDFREAASCEPTTVRGTGAYFFDFTAAGLADLADMAEHPGNNFGWLFLSESENTQKSARQFASREDQVPPSLPSRRPQLVIEFTPPATPQDPPELEPAPDEDSHAAPLTLEVGESSATLGFHGRPGQRWTVDSASVLDDPDAWTREPTFLDILPVENPGPRSLVLPRDPPLPRRFHRAQTWVLPTE